MGQSMLPLEVQNCPISKANADVQKVPISDVSSVIDRDKKDSMSALPSRKQDTDLKVS